MMFSNQIFFLVGPTAVGKTQIAYHLAKDLRAEIVSCDSMQVYREVSIASSKPSAQMLQDIPHHLIDVVSVEEEFNVAEFNTLAQDAIKTIHQQDKIPLVVGGSGLYVQVLLDGIFDEKASDNNLRNQLKQELDDKGEEVLYQRLEGLDPEAASKISPADHRRVIRALEVCVSYGQPISTLQKRREGLWGQYDIHIFGIIRPREELYDRINIRVEQMFANGLVDEVKRLSPLNLSRTAQKLIGVQEVLGFLKREYSLEQAQYLMKRNTRHFAKRQLTWFRKDKRIQWIELSDGQLPQETIKQIQNDIKKDSGL